MLALGDLGKVGMVSARLANEAFYRKEDREKKLGVAVAETNET